MFTTTAKNNQPTVPSKFGMGAWGGWVARQSTGLFYLHYEHEVVRILFLSRDKCHVRLRIPISDIFTDS